MRSSYTNLRTLLIDLDMKYIDADLLRKELERRITDNTFGAKLELIDILAWLDSLQQEQPEVDLDADIEMEWDSFKKHLAEYGEESEEVVWLNWNNFNELARYFYELGRNAIKEE